jgi:uncharacterized protein (DUF169 family)
MNSTDTAKLSDIAAELERVLKLRAIPIGMKLFESVEAMAAIPKIRRPKSTLHTTDQIVAQAARLGWTVGITAEDLVGESACADSWGRALATRKPSLSIPCFAERRYGGVLDDEMLMACPPEDLSRALEGMAAMAKNGLRYPFPQYGIQQDVRAGMAASYPDRK